MEAVAGLGGELMPKKLTDISSLVPDSKNANSGTERGRFLLEKSFRELGAGRSVVTDAEGRVIGGNKALEIAEELGLPIEVVQTQGDKLVVVQRTDLDLSDDLGPARRMAYADNAIASVNLAWSAEQIVADLDTGVDLEGMFRPEELSAILEAAADALIPGEPPEPQIDKAEELREQWQTSRGQVWTIESKTTPGKSHKVMCGDSTSAEDVARLMGGEKAGAVVTDPPYGIEREGITNDDPEGLRALYDGCLAAMPSTDAVVIAFQSPRLFPVWLDAVRGAGHKFERMLWMYDENKPVRPWRYWLMCSQAIMVSSVGKPEWIECAAHHDTYHLGLAQEWRQGGSGNEFAHATVKPVPVVKDIMAHVAGNVFDGFLGSGATMAAAEQTGRLCYGMEIEPKYVAVTLQRLADMGLEPKLSDDA